MNPVVPVLLCYVFAAYERANLAFCDGKEKEYGATSRVFALSKPLQDRIKREDAAKEEGLLPFTGDTFDMLEWMLGDSIGDRPDMDICPLYSLMHAGKCLKLPNEELALICMRLAEKSLKGKHLDKILRTRMEKGDDAELFAEFALLLLREYAGTYNTCVCVQDGAATMCISGGAGRSSEDKLPTAKDVRILPSVFNVLTSHKDGAPADVASSEAGSGNRGDADEEDTAAQVVNPAPEVPPGCQGSGMDLPAAEQGLPGCLDAASESSILDVVVWIVGHMEPFRLDLSECSILQDQASFIAHLDGLKVLSLHRCSYLAANSIFCFLVAMSSLEELDVGWCALGPEDVMAIFSRPMLRKLSMQGCSLRPGLLLDIHLLSESLEELNVAHIGLRREVAQAIISTCTRLKELNMHECGLEPGHLGGICRLTSLVMLDVGGCRLSDKNIAEMVLLPKLERLRMSGCGLLGDRLGPIKAIARLIELDVSSNTLGRSGVLVVLHHTKLRVLNMRGCKLMEGDLRGIRRLEDLEELDTVGCELGSGVVWEMLLLTKLRRLNLRDCKLVLEDLKGIGKLRYMEELDVIGCCELDLGTVQEILSLTRLMKLNLSAIGLPLNCLLGIRKLEDLREFDIERWKLSLDVAQEISSLTKLRRLSMRWCDLDPDLNSGSVSIFDIYKNIQNMQSLEELSIFASGLSVGSMTAILLLKNLRKLELDYCGLEQSIPPSIRGLARLEDLRIKNKKLSEESISSISLLPSLRKLYLNKTGLKRNDLQPIKALKFLEELDVEGCSLSNRDVCMIGLFMKLRVLCMRDCNLDPGALVSIGDLQFLTKLDVSGGSLNDADVSTIVSLGALTELYADSCRVSRENIARLRSLQNLKVLRHSEPEECIITIS